MVEKSFATDVLVLKYTLAFRSGVTEPVVMRDRTYATRWGAARVFTDESSRKPMQVRLPGDK